MALDLSVFCEVISFSHRISPDAFALLEKPECHLNVYDVSENRFFLGIHSKHGDLKTPEEFSAFGTYALSSFIMALNIATLGHFAWAANTSKKVEATFSLFNHGTRKGHGIVTNRQYAYPEEAKTMLTAAMVGHASLLWGALVKEDKSFVRSEYLKGVYHLGLEFFDLSFRKDAFANFYRSFEYFISDRILAGKKFNKELKAFSEAMRSIKMPEQIIAEFGELYRLRSEQVMHSQKEQKEIEWDDAAKMKIIADAVMNKFYEPIWKADLEAIKPT